MSETDELLKRLIETNRAIDEATDNMNKDEPYYLDLVGELAQNEELIYKLTNKIDMREQLINEILSLASDELTEREDFIALAKESTEQLKERLNNIKQYFISDIHEKIEQQISEIVQNNCKSGDVSPSQTLQLEQLTNKLADLIAQIVVQNQ